MTVMHGSYELHPACALFPPMTEAELGALAEDIASNGQRDPIVLHEGKILDGRNRLAACQRADVSPQFTHWKGEGGSPTLFVVSKNKHRRHLTPAQLAMIAADLRPLLEAEAEERQKATQVSESSKRDDRGRVERRDASSGVGTRAHTGERGTAAAAAKVVGSSTTAVKQAERIKQKAPEVAAAVREGKQSLRGGLAEVNERMSPTAGPKDELGTEIPAALLKPWGAISRAVAAVDAHLRAAQGEWTKQEKAIDEISRSSRAAAKFASEVRKLLKGATGDALRDFSGKLRELAPFAVCTNCSGSGMCPGKKCQRTRLGRACNCTNKLCGICDGTGVVTVKQKAATKHDAKKAS